MTPRADARRNELVSVEGLVPFAGRGGSNPPSDTEPDLREPFAQGISVLSSKRLREPA